MEQITGASAAARTTTDFHMDSKLTRQAYPLSAASAGSAEEAAWISVETAMPALETTVWLYEPERGMWIGGRYDDCDGWLWGNSYGSAWWCGDKWDCDAETDDDYKPTHWLPLPLPPNDTR